MAKSPKSRKSAPTALSGVGLRTVAIRVGLGVALIGLGAGVYLLHERKAEVAVSPPPKTAIVAAAPRAAPSPDAEEEAEPDAPPPPRRTADAAKPMSGTLRAAFDSWLMGAYAKCWRAPKATPEGEPYLAKVRVAFKADGELASPPKLVNPPSDPAWKPHAEAALKAVKGCDPLHVPDKYAAYYPSWKSRTVYFDPTRN